jgi:hypothetical protein
MGLGILDCRDHERHELLLMGDQLHDLLVTLCAHGLEHDRNVDVIPAAQQWTL